MGSSRSFFFEKERFRKRLFREFRVGVGLFLRLLRSWFWWNLELGRVIECFRGKFLSVGVFIVFLFSR